MAKPNLAIRKYMNLSFNDQYRLKEDFEIAGGIVCIPAGTVFEYRGEHDPENEKIFKLTSLGGVHDIILDLELFRSLFSVHNP